MSKFVISYVPCCMSTKLHVDVLMFMSGGGGDKAGRQSTAVVGLEPLDIVDEDYSKSTFVRLITLDIINKTLGHVGVPQKIIVNK